MKKITLAVLLILHIIVSPLASGHIERLSVHFFPGNVCLLQTSGGTVLVNGGCLCQGRRLVEYLYTLGVKEIDYVIATTPDAAAIGGLIYILAEFPVGVVLDSGLLNRSDIRIYFLEKAWQLQVPFKIVTADFQFWIAAGVEVQVTGTAGAAALSVQLNFADRSLLLVGPHCLDFEQALHRGRIWNSIIPETATYTTI